MTDFLIKSSVAMVLLIALYHLFLEREKMHRFNRIYLLVSLAFSLALPFISFTVYKEVTEVQEVFQEEMPMPQFSAIQVEESIDYTPYILLGIYLAITLVFVFRFIKNLLHFKSIIATNTTVKYEGATLVLLTEKVLPHTFLNYIFINKQEYENRLIEDELFTHELTHVRQKHTVDILFMETLLTVFWFNPVLYIYKKAIKLNHEFLADEGVITQTHNIINYQKLLLYKAVPATQYYLASSLNFSVTKKRFTMMTKTTPKSKAMLLKLAALPVVALLVYVLCAETVAQTVQVEQLDAVVVPKDAPAKAAKNNDKRDAYYAGVRVVVKSRGKDIVNKPYEELTEDEKDKYLMPVPAPKQKMAITAKELEAYKDKNKYAIWINERHVDNKELNNYSPRDFVYRFGSAVHKNAQSKAFPQPYQFTLYTNDYFETEFKNSHKKFGGDTYTVAIGGYNNDDDAQQQTKIKEQDVTSKMYNEYIDEVKNTAQNDTVKKTREQLLAEVEKRKAIIIAERGEMQKKRSEMMAKRDSLSKPRNASLSEKRGELNAMRAKRDSIKIERDKLKAEILAKKDLLKVSAVYQEGKVYSAGEVAVKPKYPDGIGGFYKFIMDNVKTPTGIKNKSRVYISFVIETDGSITEAKVEHDKTGLGAGNEAIKVLKLSKKWTAAKVEGKPVRCSYNLPLVFDPEK